ncbi:MAG: ERCC4 domain-containing protein [Candidatus Bilamarchaeaceae archaeon]
MEKAAPPAIAVDSREDGFFAKALEGMGAEVQVSPLPVGDFVCSDRTIVERKTRHDFESSVIDGRLFEQLSRLFESYPRVVLVVEGGESAGLLQKASLLGAYASAVTDYGAAIFFTRSPESTAELVFAIARHEQTAEKRTLRISGRPKGRTLSQNQQAIVEMLPMVGPKMAVSLLMHFGTIENIANASEEELLEVEGLGKKKAAAIRKAFSTPFEPEQAKEEGSAGDYSQS